MAKGLNIPITADAKGVQRGAREAEGALERVNKAAERSRKHFEHLATFAAGVTGIGGLTIGLHEIAKGAVEAEAAQAKLDQALKNAGLSVSRYREEIDKTIDKQSLLSGFTKADLSDAFANMVRTTGNVREALRLNGVAADIARTKGINLAGAQSLLARVYNGSYIGLKRLGISITPVTKAQDALRESTKNATVEQQRHAKELDKSATAQEALRTVTQKFSGQAEAYGKTAAGSFARAHAAIQLAQEEIGTVFLPVIAKAGEAIGKLALDLKAAWPEIKQRITDAIHAVVGAVRDVIGWFERHRTTTLALEVAVSAAVAAFVAFKTATLAAAAAAKVMAVAQAALDVVMDANPIGLVILALAALAAALVVAYKRSETFRRLLKDAWAQISKAAEDAWKAIRRILDGMLTTMRGWLKILSGLLHGNFRQMWAGVEQIFQGAAKTLGGSAQLIGAAITGGLRTGLGVFASVGTDVINSLIDLLNGGIDAINTALKAIPSVNLPGLGHIGVGTIPRIGYVGSPTTAGSIVPAGQGSHFITGGNEGGTNFHHKTTTGKGGGGSRAGTKPVSFTFGSLKVPGGMPSGGGGGGTSGGGGSKKARTNALLHKSHYNHTDLMELWVLAGGPANVADTAAAIAEAESGGNPGAGASHPYHGLWQVGPGGSFDPWTNAQQAVGKYRNAPGGGNNFSPWTTYTGADTGPGGGPGAKTYIPFLTGQTISKSGSSTSGFGIGTGMKGTWSKAQNAAQKFAQTMAGRHGKQVANAIKFAPAQTGSALDVELAGNYYNAVLADPSIDVAGAGPAGRPGFAIGMAKAKYLTAIQKRIAKIKKALKGKLSPAKRSALLAELEQLGGTVKDLTASTDTAADGTTAPTPLDYANASLALAQLTPGTDDDLAALKTIQGLDTTALSSAIASGDPLKIADAAQALKGVNDAIDQLTAAVSAQSDALTAEVKRGNDLTEQIRNTDSGILKGALADAVSSSIGGPLLRGLGTPSFAGGGVSY